MKKLTMCFVLAAVPAMFAQQSTSSNTPPVQPVGPAKKQIYQPKGKPSAQKAAPVTLPQGATEVNANTYSYTDPQGKKWLYRKTPFGLVKMEDSGQQEAPVADKTNPTVVKDEGDTVRFERKTPFGVETVVRKKSELTDDEKALVEQSKQQSPAAATASAQPAKAPGKN